MKLISSHLKTKLAGLHTTIIGGRESYRMISNISKCDKIKSVVPSIICCKQRKGLGSCGLVFRIQRPDDHGNLRLLLSFGSTYQEVRLITTVSNQLEGKKLQIELNELIKKYKEEK